MSIIQEVTIISEDYLKKNSILNINIDTDKIRPAIVNAQVIEIQQLLGTKLLKKILQLINDEQLVGSGVYQTLVDEYIIPTMVEYSLYYALLDISFQAYNKGVMQRSSEFAQPSSLKEIQYIRNDVKNRAEFLAQRLYKYICDNKNDYPEYSSSDDIKAFKHSPYTDNFAFPYIRKYKFLK